ncbi:MAG: hypothetical protein K1X94_12020 [Sandaracinaceae bacterium]|nr:hypothetical protein [Sandaracinaceae bacterium]
MHHRTIRTLSLVALALVGGLLTSSCSASPANAAGSWSMNLTNGANGCMFSNWTVGDTTTGVPVTITQSGASVTLLVTGGYATALDLLVGGHEFTGAVDGNHVNARLTGRAGSTGGCAYTTVGDLEGTLSGDTITGNLSWSYDTNSSADCGMYAVCETLQAMNGTRPPTSM